MGRLSPPYSVYLLFWGVFFFKFLFCSVRGVSPPARLRGAEDGVEMAGRAGGVPSADDVSGGESSRRTGAARQASGPVAGERPYHRWRERHRAPARPRVRRTRRQKGTEAQRLQGVGAEGVGNPWVGGGASTCCGRPNRRRGLRVAGHPTSRRHAGVLS